MYARSTTLQARPGSIDAGITYFRDEIMPELGGLEGFVGASMIVDRESGLCIVTANYSSPEARQASAEAVMPMRDRAAAVFGAESVEVEEWEIAVMHRDHRTHEGTCVRVTWSRVDPAGAEQGIEAWKLGALPALEAMDGFCSASLLVNRELGRAVGSVTFDTREAMEASREQAAAIRARVKEQARAEILDVREFELAVAHLDAPEMV